MSASFPASFRAAFPAAFPCTRQPEFGGGVITNDHLLDELGNILTDEFGNQLTGKEVTHG